jgi:hypothetical protein
MSMSLSGGPANVELDCQTLAASSLQVPPLSRRKERMGQSRSRRDDYKFRGGGPEKSGVVMTGSLEIFYPGFHPNFFKVLSCSNEWGTDASAISSRARSYYITVSLDQAIMRTESGDFSANNTALLLIPGRHFLPEIRCHTPRRVLSHSTSPPFREM